MQEWLTNSFSSEKCPPSVQNRMFNFAKEQRLSSKKTQNDCLPTQRAIAALAFRLLSFLRRIFTEQQERCCFVYRSSVWKQNTFLADKHRTRLFHFCPYKACGTKWNPPPQVDENPFGMKHVTIGSVSKKTKSTWLNGSCFPMADNANGLWGQSEPENFGLSWSALQPRGVSFQLFSMFFGVGSNNETSTRIWINNQTRQLLVSAAEKPCWQKSLVSILVKYGSLPKDIKDVYFLLLFLEVKGRCSSLAVCQESSQCRVREHVGNSHASCAVSQQAMVPVQLYDVRMGLLNLTKVFPLDIVLFTKLFFLVQVPSKWLYMYAFG